MKNNKNSIYLLAETAMMAAVVCVVTLFRFPLLGSKVHFANAMCLIAGLIFGPVSGGIAAGLGSMLYDVLFGGYDFINGLMTFVMKFAMAWLCAMIAGRTEGRSRVRVCLASVIGALSYVALYLIKTYFWKLYVDGLTQDVVWAAVVSKAPASLINAAAALIAAPIIYYALLPSLRKLHLPRGING